MEKWYWTSTGVSISIPDEDILPALRQMFIEKLKIRILLMTKIFDGGKEIRCPLK